MGGFTLGVGVLFMGCVDLFPGLLSTLPNVFFGLSVVLWYKIELIFFMDVGGLYVYLDRRRLNVFSYLEKDFFFGANV